MNQTSVLLRLLLGFLNIFSYNVLRTECLLTYDIISLTIVKVSWKLCPVGILPFSIKMEINIFVTGFCITILCFMYIYAFIYSVYICCWCYNFSNETAYQENDGTMVMKFFDTESDMDLENQKDHNEMIDLQTTSKCNYEDKTRY